MHSAVMPSNCTEYKSMYFIGGMQHFLGGPSCTDSDSTITFPEEELITDSGLQGVDSQALLEHYLYDKTGERPFLHVLELRNVLDKTPVA